MTACASQVRFERKSTTPAHLIVTINEHGIVGLVSRYEDPFEALGDVKVQANLNLAEERETTVPLAREPSLRGYAGPQGRLLILKRK